MGQKLRKMVMKRAALCDLVTGAARIQGPELGIKFGEYLAPALVEGEVLPDFGAVIQLYGRRLQGFRDTMVETDADYLEQRALLADLYLESEKQTGKLKASILSLRSTCEGLLGEESLRALALDFNVAQDPRGVLRQGEILRDRLSKSERELVPERWVDGPIISTDLAAELDGEIAEVRLVVTKIVEQRKVVDTAKVRKDQAKEEFDRQFIPIARLLEATFRVAGETELADRIRPTVRQLGREDGQDPEPEEPEANAPEATPTSDSDIAVEAASSAS